MKRAAPGSLAMVSLVTVLVLAGCGFHLRGNELSANFERVYVGAVSAVTIERQLARSLGFAGVEVVTDRSAADVVIDLTAQRENRRSVSVTERARTAEYELSLEIRYRIVAQEPVDAGAEPVQTVLVEDRSIRVARTYRLDRNNLVAGSEEQSLLRGEMEQDLVQQILRSLDTATRNRASAPQVTTRADQT
jgi:LPS-assembly lipoprotein